jgi:Ser/Thr protein kinase RdoA (MazF antagonist)
MVERYEAELAGRLRRWPRQLLHNDANPSTVLYDTADTDRISGVFDFGDLVVGVPVQELAVACTYVLREGLGGADPLSSVGWVVSGWAAARPVEEEELAMLIELIALRAAVSVMITSWRSRVFPEEAPYLLRNFAANHAALAFLEALPRGPAVQALRAAAARRP